MIAFGMKTTLVRFQDKYYNYKGVIGNDTEKGSEDDNGLAIGAFEVAFCADTVPYLPHLSAPTNSTRPM
eukprot:4227407-Ditylum_brightwellii.AAC.1